MDWKLNLDRKKWRQVIIHACLVGSAALLTFILESVGTKDFGMWAPLVLWVGSIVLKYIQKIIEQDMPVDPKKVTSLSIKHDTWHQAALDD